MDREGRRVVVFGCGYLGARVAIQALKRGMRVAALTRNADRAGELTRLGIQQVVTAELDRSEWHPLLDPRQDLVVNCVSSAGGGWDGYRKSYLEGMRSILDWASSGRIGTLVYTSSTSVYEQGGGDWVTELDRAGASSEGGKILCEAERLLEEGPAAVKRRFILRLGGIYGPKRHHLLTRALSDLSEKEGDSIYLNSVHVDDAVAAVWAAAEADPGVEGGIFNIVDDMPARKGEIVAYLRERVSERGLGQSDTETPALASRRRLGPRPNRRLSNRKAREVLGWHPRYPDYRAGYEPLLDALI